MCVNVFERVPKAGVCDDGVSIVKTRLLTHTNAPTETRLNGKRPRVRW